MSERVPKSVYFKKKHELELLDWVLTKGMPAADYTSFSAYIKHILAEKMREAKVRPTVLKAQQGVTHEEVADMLKQLEDRLTSTLVNTLSNMQPVIVNQKPTAPPKVGVRKINHDFHTLVGDDPDFSMRD